MDYVVLTAKCINLKNLVNIVTLHSMLNQVSRHPQILEREIRFVYYL